MHFKLLENKLIDQSQIFQNTFLIHYYKQTTFYIIFSNFLASQNTMSSKQKTKKINKNNKNKKQKQQKLQLVQEDQVDDITKGDPVLKNLSDFVTALTPTYVSKAIYTGGRIVAGNQKIYAACNHQITIYGIKQQAVLQKIRHKNQQIVNFGIDPSQRNIITFTNNSLLRVVNIQTQKVLHKVKLNQKFFVYDIAYSPDSKFVALGFSNSMIKIYTTQTMKQTHSYKNHNMSVRKVQWHRNPQTLQIISIDEDKNLVVFDYILNKVIGHIKDAGKYFVQTAKGTNVVVSSDQEIKVFDYKSLTVLYKVDVPDYVDSMLYLQSGMLIFGGQDTGVFNIDLNMSNKKRQIRSDVKTIDTGVMKILPISNGKQFLVVSAEQNISVVDSKTLKTLDTIIGYNDQIIDIKYSKSSRKQKNQSDFVIVITNSSNAKIFNRHTMKLVSFLTGHQDTILCLEYFHPYVLTAGKDKVIKLHQIDPLGRSTLIANYTGHSEYICGLSVMIDKKIIISASQDKTIKIWPIVQQKQQKIQIKTAISTVSAHPKSINAVRTSPNEDFIATCSHDRTVKIWGSDLRLYFTLSGHRRGVWDAAFHSVQKLVVTVASDGALKGWSLFTGECLWSLGQGLALMRCSWIYHHQVVTASIDGIVKIWDIRKQTSLSYDKHEGKIWALQVLKDQSTDNKIQLMTGGVDSTLYVWKDSTQQTRQKIMKNQELQQQQRIQLDQLLHDGKFVEAALLAFQNNYTQLFINIVNKMFTFYNDAQEVKEVTFDDDRLMINQDEEAKVECQQMEQQTLKSFVKQLFDIDNNKFLNLLYIMTSTVKNYRSASILFFSLLKSIPLSKIVSMDKIFNLTSAKRNDLQDLNSKKSEFQQFLQKMEIYTEKHLNRLERYQRGTYYLDHLAEKERVI